MLRKNKQRYGARTCTYQGGLYQESNEGGVVWHLGDKWSNGVWIRVGTIFLQTCKLINDRGTIANACEVNKLFNTWMFPFHNKNKFQSKTFPGGRFQCEIVIFFNVLEKHSMQGEKEEKHMHIHTYTAFLRNLKHKKNVERVPEARAIRQDHGMKLIEKT